MKVRAPTKQAASTAPIVAPVAPQNETHGNEAAIADLAPASESAFATLEQAAGDLDSPLTSRSNGSSGADAKPGSGPSSLGASWEYDQAWVSQYFTGSGYWGFDLEYGYLGSKDFAAWSQDTMKPWARTQIAPAVTQAIGALGKREISEKDLRRAISNVLGRCQISHPQAPLSVASVTLSTPGGWDGKMEPSQAQSIHWKLNPMTMSLPEAPSVPVRIHAGGRLAPKGDADERAHPVEARKRFWEVGPLIWMRSAAYEQLADLKPGDTISIDKGALISAFSKRVDPTLDPDGWAVGLFDELEIQGADGRSLSGQKVPEAPEAKAQELTKGTGNLRLLSAARTDQYAYEKKGQGVLTGELAQQIEAGRSVNTAGSHLSGDGLNQRTGMDQEAVTDGVGGFGASKEGQKVSLHVGIDRYGAGISNLDGAVNDARLLAKTLGAKGYTTALLANPTAAEMDAAYRQVAETVGDGDALTLSFAGHGSREKGLLGSDTVQGDGPYLPWGTLSRIAAKATSQGASADVVIDACHSGAEVDALRAQESGELTGLAERLGPRGQALKTIRDQLTNFLSTAEHTGSTQSRNLAKTDNQLLSDLAIALSSYDNDFPKSWSDLLDRKTIRSVPKGALHARRLILRAELLLRQWAEDAGKTGGA
ncbi:MAG: caspase family protein [Myxococcota bacterium]